MKLIKPLSFIMAMAFSGMTMASVTITVPDSVDFLAANSQEPHISGSLFSSERTITLPNGDNQIVFKYTPHFTQGKDTVTARSEAIIAKFTAKDAKLHFELPKYSSASIAQKSINTMQWNLADEAGHKLSVKKDKLIKEGMQVGRDYPREAQNYNTKGGIAAIVTPLTLTQRALSQGDLKELKGKNTAEEMLHFWYSKADAKTKAKFKEFVLNSHSDS